MYYLLERKINKCRLQFWKGKLVKEKQLVKNSIVHCTYRATSNLFPKCHFKILASEALYATNPISLVVFHLNSVLWSEIYIKK